MKNEKLYIYYYSAQNKEAEKLHTQIQTFGLEAELVNLDRQSSDVELVNGLIEHSNNPFPILRIGDLKIRAIFQNPNNALLEKLFSDSSDKQKLPEATIYSTVWCGDCTQLKMWMDSQKIAYKEILIQDTEELKEQITRWSGGRRVIPTVEYESIFNVFKL